MRNLYASTLKYSVLGLFLVQPMYAHAACPTGVTPAPNGRLLAAQCAQCHGSGGGEDLGSYVSATGAEGPQAMHWQLQGYSDAQRCAIANYYATGVNNGGGGTPPPPPPPPGPKVQTINFGAAPSIIVNGTGTVTATGGNSGNPVTLISTTISTCTLSSSTVTGATVTGVVKGVAAGACTIAANQTGNSTYSAASQVTQSFTIEKGTQTLTFSAAPSIAVGQNGTVSATSTSGLTPTYSSLTSSTCTISGSSVHGVAAGTCTIAANQAGNGNYSAATQVTQSITVRRRRGG